LKKHHSHEEIRPFYETADLCMVTSLHDGMNLVAKEFIAAQNADDPGVLILSRFAGAAYECSAALLVNPYDSEGVGNAISRALSMPLDERRQRHAATFKVLVRNDLSHWSERFLRTLEHPPGGADAPALVRAAGGR
jgi:trehalose 6-phosphate synthase